jgi:hypothetical protein
MLRLHLTTLLLSSNISVPELFCTDFSLFYNSIENAILWSAFFKTNLFTTKICSRGGSRRRTAIWNAAVQLRHSVGNKVQGSSYLPKGISRKLCKLQSQKGGVESSITVFNKP